MGGRVGGWVDRRMDRWVNGALSGFGCMVDECMVDE